MCGISGFCSFENDYTSDKGKWTEALSKMCKAVSYRGLGDLYSDTNIYKSTTCQLKDICVSLDGEIYNKNEIKKSLNTKIDNISELIALAYLQNGIDFVNMLNGVFAISVWDKNKKRLLLIRDRIGAKPLFYSMQNNAIVFSSETKGLFCHPDINASCDDDGLREIFGICPARTSGNGIFKGVFEVKSGHIVIYTSDGIKSEKYWDLKADEHKESYAETCEKVFHLLRESVVMQTEGEDSLCSFLSGGLDSSVVTALASNYLSGEGKKLNTFSFDFKNNDTYFEANAFQPGRDRPYVDKMLKFYPLNHKYLECDERLLPTLVMKAVDVRCYPGMADVDASMNYFCAEVSKEYRVALTGECSDEIFGGYPWFYREELLNADGFPWSWDISAREVLLKDEVIKRLNLKEYVYARYLKAIDEVSYLDCESGEEKRRREVSYLNIHWFMQTLLERMERAGSVCGLRGRVPFADYRLVEYLYNVPWSMKYKDGVEKALLRSACGELLPDELLYRKKSPFPKTYDRGYTQVLGEELYKVINDKSEPINEFLDKEKTERFILSPGDYGRPWFGQLMAGPQMMAYMLQVNKWLKEINA